MGGKTQDTTSTTTNDAPSWAQDFLKKMAGDLANQYNKGQGGHVYNRQWLGNLSDTTKNAINGVGGVTNQYSNAYLNGLMNMPNNSAQNLSDMARGKMMGQNGAFNDALQHSLNQAATTINSQMSGAGRMGSGANTQILGNSLGNITNQAVANQYNQDVQNMMHANNQIDQSNYNQMNTANNWLTGQGNAFLNMLHGGQILDQHNQNKIDADRQRWQAQDNEGMNRIQNYANVLRRLTGGYGQQQTDQEKPVNWLGELGGGGSIFGQLLDRLFSNKESKK